MVKSRSSSRVATTTAALSASTSVEVTQILSDNQMSDSNYRRGVDMMSTSLEADASLDGTPGTATRSSPFSPLERALEKSEISQLNLSTQLVLVRELPASECGRFAQIYEGNLRVCQTRVKVAVKCLFMRSADGETLDKDIARELRIWSKLKHHNILPFRGYAIIGEYPAFLSDWMEYGTLWKYMEDGNLDKIGELSMIRGIASGLSYMHSEGAIHSDLRSDNVLVSHERQPLLTDFGASRMADLSKGHTTDSLLANERWIAIELFEGQDKHTEETDVWAFGMTIYELLARSQPYSTVGDEYVRPYIINGGQPVKPNFSMLGEHSTPHGVIDEYAWLICEKCWRKEPGRRPSMHDLETEINSRCKELGA